MNKAENQAFEKWAASMNMGGTNFGMLKISGLYADTRTSLAWAAWQASISKEMGAPISANNKYITGVTRTKCSEFPNGVPCIITDGDSVLCEFTGTNGEAEAAAICEKLNNEDKGWKRFALQLDETAKAHAIIAEFIPDQSVIDILAKEAP